MRASSVAADLKSGKTPDFRFMRRKPLEEVYQTEPQGRLILAAKSRDAPHRKEVRGGMVVPEFRAEQYLGELTLTLAQEIVKRRGDAQQILGRAGRKPVRVAVPFEPERRVKTLVHAIAQHFRHTVPPRIFPTWQCLGFARHVNVRHGAESRSRVDVDLKIT